MDVRKENELGRQMDLLQMKEITTNRQEKNGTRIFQLPIKKYGQFIEVGSFESGYIRRMNGCYTPYQLNKCEGVDHYYKDYKWNENFTKQTFTGKYNKYVGKKRILIPNEVDRLEYLIAYCLKNYYINQANQVENGEFVHKWQHEYEMKNGSLDKVRELQSENNRLHNIYLKQTIEITELKKEIDKLNNEIVDSRDRGMLDNLTVFVNNEKYKII